MPDTNKALELPTSPGEAADDALTPRELGTLTNTVVDTANPHQMGAELEPEAILARELALNLPQFKNMVDTLSNRQLRRVLKAIVEVPLNDTKYKATSEAERFIFKCADTILQCKFALMLRTYSESIETLQAASEGKTLEEIQKETVEKEKSSDTITVDSNNKGETNV